MGHLCGGKLRSWRRRQGAERLPFRRTAFCDVIQYLDTNWIYQNGSPPWHPFTAAARKAGTSTCRGRQPAIVSSGYGGGYLINQTNPAVQSFFQSYVRSHYGAEDGLMMDDQSASLSSQLFYATCGCGSTRRSAPPRRCTPRTRHERGDDSFEWPAVPADRQQPAAEPVPAAGL